MQRTLIIDALNTEKAQSNITLCGWVRTRRDAKGFSFVEINDGSCLANMQCIVDEGTEAYAALGEANTGAALAVAVEPAGGAKCERCWKQTASVGGDGAHPTLCARCAAAVANIPEF